MRRLLAVLALIAGLLATSSAARGDSGTPFEFRGVAMKLPASWFQRVAPAGANTLPAITVGSMRPGRPEYLLGHDDPRLRWPAGGVLLSLIDWSGRDTGAMRFRRASLPLHAPPRDVGGFEGISPDHAFVRIQVRVRCKRMELWVEFGRRLSTCATVARANAVLRSLSLAPGACSPP